MIPTLLYYLIRLLHCSYRYTFVGERPKGQYIYALWHQNLIGAIFSHIGERYTMIVSESKDGELVARTCEKLGHRPARGSSTRGGLKAMLKLMSLMKEDKMNAAISVDGPKGPAFVVKPGVLEVALKLQIPLIPLSPYAENAYVFKKSWDQFRFPMPFSRIVVVIGQPVDLSGEKATKEELLTRIADAIHEGERLAIETLTR